MWTPFLKDFKQHLAAKGWLEKTNIAMDERSPEAMDAAVKVLEKCAPEMGFALADNHSSYKRYTMMRDVCVNINQKFDRADLDARRAEGYSTTFYVCCGPHFPNTFTYSNPWESELLGWYGLAAGFDGMLRWAYNSYPKDPAYDSRFSGFPSGDTYFVYPYGRSSIRMEKLVEGIQNVEKVRLLREADPAKVKDIDASLKNRSVKETLTILGALPESMRKSITKVTAETQDSVTTTLNDGDRVIIWGDSSQLKLKLAEVEEIDKNITAGTAGFAGKHQIDVSSSQKPIIK